MKAAMKAASALLPGALALAVAFPAAALPQPKTEHGITYLSGGIGEDESTAMKAEVKDYPLSLVFSAGKDGAYLAEIPVTIKDRAGNTVLDTVSHGPIMLLKLAPGEYRIEATRNGDALHRTVSVKAKGDTQVVLHWPSA